MLKFICVDRPKIANKNFWKTSLMTHVKAGKVDQVSADCPPFQICCPSGLPQELDTLIGLASRSKQCKMRARIYM